MYRAAETKPVGDQFVDRLYSLPLVTSAWGQLGALYTGTKEHNRLFRFTLGTAESGLGLVVNTAKPVIAKFEKPIGSLNGLACQQLEKLERDYPIITKPTDVVLKQTAETCGAVVKPIADRVKPITDTVGSVGRYSISKVSYAKDYTYDTIDGVKSYGVEKVNEARSYGVNKVNEARSYGVNKVAEVRQYGVRTVTGAAECGSKRVTRLLDSQVGRVVAARVDSVIDVADRYVDHYLPEDLLSDKPLHSLGVDEPERRPLTSKALSLGNKLRRRGYARVAKQLSAVKLRSAETIERLDFSVNLIEYARNNLEGARVKVHVIWEEVNKSPDQMADEVTEHEKNRANLTLERRAIATARHLTQRLKANLGGVTLGRTWDLVPGVVRTQVLRCQDLTHALYQTFSKRARTGLTSDDVTAVRATIGQLRQTLGSVLDWAPIAAVVPTLQRMIPFSISRSSSTDPTFCGPAEPISCAFRSTAALELQQLQQQQQQEEEDADEKMNRDAGEQDIDEVDEEDRTRDVTADEDLTKADDDDSDDDDDDDDEGGDEGGDEGEGEEGAEKGGRPGDQGDEMRQDQGQD